MTQQQISKLLDVPDRTLRDWKKSRQRLYALLESLEYGEAKEKINAVDVLTLHYILIIFFGKQMNKVNKKFTLLFQIIYRL